MKKVYLSVLAIVGLFTGSAFALETTQLAQDIMLNELQASIMTEMHVANVINWKVGEYQEYEISASFGNLGNVKKTVASEKDNAIWVNSDMSGGMIGEHKAEALIDRATGKLLELRQDGKKQEIPNDKIEIINQEATKITVPAGTFDVIHITAKSEKIKKLDVWANPRDITMDGTAQMELDSGMLPMTLKLTKFGGR